LLVEGGRGIEEGELKIENRELVIGYWLLGGSKECGLPPSRASELSRGRLRFAVDTDFPRIRQS
jgi:hypothetical protein